VTAARVLPALCPYCGHTLDKATLVTSDARPAPGDFYVCLRCAGLLLLGSDLRPAKPGLGVYEAACAAHPNLAVLITRMRRAVILGTTIDPTPAPTRH